MSGFTFAGVHSSAQGCHYRPDAKARGGWAPEYEVEELTAEGRDGGYYTGARVKSRVFELDCYFEEITGAQLEGIYRWLDRRNHGDQIFDERPFVRYEAFPSKRIEISLYDHSAEDGLRYSGTFTAYLTCYEPFGLQLYTQDDGSCGEEERMATGILPATVMPPAPTADSANFLLYNPGTETAHTIFRLAGSVGEDGLLIRNFTTGQRCKVTGLKASSLLPGACLELDSRRGQARIALGGETELAFPFHDEGYITLAPCTPFVRSLEIGHTQGSNAVTSQGGFLPHMEGQYLYLGGWLRIQQVTDASNAILSGSAASTGSAQVPVVTMNEIELSGTAQLTKLEVEIFPRVR